jgi:hypothetical protein
MVGWSDHWLVKALVRGSDSCFVGRLLSVFNLSDY